MTTTGSNSAARIVANFAVLLLLATAAAADWRDITTGSTIPDENYSDQPSGKIGDASLFMENSGKIWKFGKFETVTYFADLGLRPAPPFVIRISGLIRHSPLGPAPGG
jgi:hypothetical protein